MVLVLENSMYTHLTVACCLSDPATLFDSLPASTQRLMYSFVVRGRLLWACLPSPVGVLAFFHLGGCRSGGVILYSTSQQKSSTSQHCKRMFSEKLPIVDESEAREKLRRWREGLEAMGQRVNLDKIKGMISRVGGGCAVIVCVWLCAGCHKGVGSNSILCNGCTVVCWYIRDAVVFGVG